MKIKKSILVLSKIFIIMFITSILFISCNDVNKRIENVKKVYPNSKIYKQPKIKSIFYVVDSTGMRIVSTGSFNDASVNNIYECILIK